MQSFETVGKIIIIIFLVFIFSSRSVHADASHVVISEVQIGGTTSTDEFVELYNPTDSPIDLTGYRLSKRFSSGSLVNLRTSITGTINSHGYFLITHPTGYTGSITPDNVYSTGSSITADNTILLYSDGGITVIDKLGFGNSWDDEGDPYPTNPPDGGSLERIGVDTNNNSVDFVIRIISDPQNTFSTTPSPSPTPEPTESPTPTPTEVPMPTPTEVPTPTPVPTPSPTESPTPVPTNSPAPSPSPIPFPPGWSKSPVFTCTNIHIPVKVYLLLKFLMPQKFNCVNT